MHAPNDRKNIIKHAHTLKPIQSHSLAHRVHTFGLINRFSHSDGQVHGANPKETEKSEPQLRNPIEAAAILYSFQRHNVAWPIADRESSKNIPKMRFGCILKAQCKCQFILR